jgi:WS/DGAT/MGAT family acyltransferase
MAPAGEPLSKVDTAWLHMDSASNLLMILGVWTFRPGLSYEGLCRRLRERLLRYPRFRQRVHEDTEGARWIDHDVDLAEHVLREKLPPHRAGHAQAALQQRVGELAMVPLDRGRPLWQMHLVEHHDGGSALILRIHHCIADGIALVGVTMSLMDGGAPPPRRPPRHVANPAEAWLAGHLAGPLASLAIQGLAAAGGGAARSIARLVAAGPGGGHDGRALVRLGARLVQDAAALLLMPDDTRTRLKGTPGNVKRVAWCPPLPLEAVKQIAVALDCSINDVLLSCVAGAIGEYLAAQGDSTEGVEIRTMVPVNLRGTEEAYQLGNHFGLAPLVLPVGLANPLERLHEVHRRMEALKGSTQPVLAFAVLAIAGLLAKPLQDLLLDLFRHKTTAVMTNVPGPRERLRMLGSTLEQAMFWVPQSGDVGLGVSVLSYGGGVQFGVVADKLLCPDPQEIIDRFEPEFAKLALAVDVLGRDPGFTPPA